jgi:hypothetical protein
MLKGSVDATKSCGNKRGVESSEMVGNGVQKSSTINSTAKERDDQQVGTETQTSMHLDGCSSNSEWCNAFLREEELDGDSGTVDSSIGVRRNLFYEFEASWIDSTIGGQAKSFDSQRVEDDPPADVFATFFNSLTTKEKDDVMKGFESYMLEHHPEIQND